MYLLQSIALQETVKKKLTSPLHLDSDFIICVLCNVVQKTIRITAILSCLVEVSSVHGYG